MKALEKKTTNSRAICNSVLFKSYKAGGFSFLPFLFARNEVENSTDDKRKKQDVVPYRWWQADVFLIKVKLFCLKVLKNSGKYGTMLL